MSIEQFFEEAQRRQAESFIKVAEFMEQKAALEVLAANEARDEAVVKREASELLKRQYRNCMRPSLTLKAEVIQEGDTWRAAYGDCVGHGVTPETACLDFDRIWTGKDRDE